MTLSEILQNLDAFDEEATIIVEEPWGPNSRAQVIESPSDGNISNIDRDGMSYFLEVCIVHEFKQEWSPDNGGVEALCERLIQYAINDA